MDSPSPPAAPDPVKTAEAQTASNRETAISNAYLNRIDQYGPNGTVKYNIKGYGPNGEPQYEQRTEFSPTQQGLYDTTNKIAQGAGDIGVQQLDTLKQKFAEPFELDAAVGKQQFDMQRQLLDPVWDRQRATAENRLIQKGFNVGSEGYTRGMGDQATNENNAYLQAMLGSRQQGTQEALLNRTQPLNELNAFRTGSQYQMPQFQSVPGVTQANTDVAGITNAATNQQMQLYNAENAKNNAMMGGLFSVGAAAMPFMFSDRRLKTEIVRTGTGKRGLSSYAFRYVWGGPMQFGYMADEVEQVAPWAVHEMPNGFLAVNMIEV